MIDVKQIDKNISDGLLDNIPVGIIIFDYDGRIRFVNKSLRDYQLLYPDTFFSTSTGKNIYSDDILINRSLTDELTQLKEGIPFEKEVEEKQISYDSLIRLIIKGTPLIHQDNAAGGILLIEDIKVTKKAGPDSAIENSYVKSLITSLTDLFLVIDNKQLIKFIAGNTSLIFPEDPGNSEKAISSLINEDIYQQIDKLILQVHRTKKSVNKKIFVNDSDNKKWLNLYLNPQFYDEQKISTVQIFVKDITEAESDKIRLTENLKISEHYKKVTCSAGYGLFILDEENKVLFWDDNCEVLSGFNFYDVLNKPVNNFIHQLDDSKISEVKALLHNNERVTGRFKITHGSEKFIEGKFSFNENDNNHLMILCTDITAEVQQVNELNDSINNLSQLLSNANFLIAKTDEDGNFIYINQNFTDTFGYSIEELKDKRLYDLIDQAYFEDSIFDIRSAEPSVPVYAELPFRKKNGDLSYFSITVSPEKINNSKKFYDCYIKDINEHLAKAKEGELFRSMFSASNDGIALAQDGILVFVNKAFAEIFNYSSGDELVGKPMLDLVSGNDSFKIAENFRMLERKKGSPSRFDFLGKRNDGSVFHAEVSAGTYELESKQNIIMIVRDVSERIRTQRVIRESEEKYRNITENIDDFLFTFERIDSNLRPVFCTTSVQKITGYLQTDFLSDGKLFLKIIHPDDFNVFKPKLMNLLKSRIQNSGEFEFRIINKHGNIVWVRTKLNLVRIGAGTIQKIFGLVSDITFRKRAEEELKKSTKNLIKLNETKDRFISIVSHDLRTPFSSILGFTDLLLNDNDLTEDEQKQYFRYIQDSSKSMLALVNSLLDWTRLQTGRIKFEPQKFDVASTINETINTVSGVSLQKGVELINLIKDEKLIFADKSLIMQVFNNLLSNAIKFTSQNGKIYISAAPSDNPRFTEFSVKDTGVGIKPENLDKLFSVEAKFTSEGTAGEKGSGLGLSLVKEIIEKHGGAIRVKSKVGEGSDFRFTLPIASAQILIVDDNKTDRLLYSKILKNITPDYEVEVASNGKEALEKIKSSHPALVITDHSMPVMNGYEFVIELQKLEMKGKPPVIVLSSDIDRNAINDYNGIGIEYVFHKPVNLGHFKQAVEKSLRKSFTSN